MRRPLLPGPGISLHSRRVWRLRLEQFIAVRSDIRAGLAFTRWFCPARAGALTARVDAALQLDQKKPATKDWKGGRVVEGTGLENRQWGNSLVGSNPTPSARRLIISNI
jgi:hypothetical protein